LYKREEKKKEASETGGSAALDCTELYTNYCASCHLANGQGLSGAFPPLAGSKIVNDDDRTSQVNFIMYGYDAREEYGAMAAIGQINEFIPEEVTAIINHERTNWGNNGREVKVDEVSKLMDFLKNEAVQ